MACSPDEGSTGRLLSKRAESLFQRFGSGELRRLGWFQYRDHDRPQTWVATELAAECGRLMTLITATPVDRSAISDGFLTTFPPTPAAP